MGSYGIQMRPKQKLSWENFFGLLSFFNKQRRSRVSSFFPPTHAFKTINIPIWFKDLKGRENIQKQKMDNFDCNTVCVQSPTQQLICIPSLSPHIISVRRILEVDGSGPSVCKFVLNFANLKSINVAQIKESVFLNVFLGFLLGK